eukprot:TRINITY_DN94610_c0_g1_i1.p1 TRINITY_DN94610_c0_g1~~TRINITY_DN94610_c0_g1_i1.p1  ORF type:complete len:455 (+),score=83.70 TRINITY_DN94610_c0_g1_i1:62-1426(+)
MAAKSVRRPQSLIAQTQDHLRSSQAANRQRLRESGVLADGQRPPQLPGSQGYPPALASPAARAGEEVAESSRSTPSRSGSSPRGNVARTGSGHSTRLPSLEASLPLIRSPRRSLSGTGGSLPPRSPSVASASSRSGRPASRGTGDASPSCSPSAQGRGDADDLDDDDFEQQLQELEELSQHLLRRGEPLSRGGASASLEHRPTTGGTSASESTTAPASSLATVEVEDSAADAGSEENALRSLRGAQLAHHEIANIRLPHGCRIETSGASFAQLFFTMDVSEGPYTPATLTFWVKIFSEYPVAGSFSIRSTKRIFHPNIDAQSGAVSIPGYDVSDVAEASEVHLSTLLQALAQLVKVPTESPAVNEEAASLLQTDPDEFRRTVRLCLNGGDHCGVRYDRLLNIGKVPKTPQDRDMRAMPEDLRLSLMKLEVMKEEFKATASAYIANNEMQLRHLA